MLRSGWQCFPCYRKVPIFPHCSLQTLQPLMVSRHVVVLIYHSTIEDTCMRGKDSDDKLESHYVSLRTKWHQCVAWHDLAAFGHSVTLDNLDPQALAE